MIPEAFVLDGDDRVLHEFRDRIDADVGAVLFTAQFGDEGAVAVVDPRRLGGLEGIDVEVVAEEGVEVLRLDRAGRGDEQGGEKRESESAHTRSVCSKSVHEPRHPRVSLAL